MYIFQNSALMEALLAVLNNFHSGFTVLYAIAVIAMLTQKYSPVSQLYIASFATLQIIWDGCPIAAFINIFNQIGNFTFERTEFFWGFAGEWTPMFRFALLILTGLLYWSSYETWEKSIFEFNLSNYFKRGTFKMEKEGLA